MTSEGGLIRPKVTLKLATSLDARIATRTGESQWITGPEARTQVHHMRANHDGVLTGIGSVLTDDPELTSRLDPPAARQPWRIVLDSQARLPLDSRLVQTCHKAGLIWFTTTSPPLPAFEAVEGLSHHLVGKDPSGVGVDLRQVLQILVQEHGIKNLMVETGPILATAFLRAGFVDQIAWFRAPIVLGGDGRPVFDSLNVQTLSQALVFEPIDHHMYGRDHLTRFGLSSS